jgi:hypothetical protein
MVFFYLIFFVQKTTKRQTPVPLLHFPLSCLLRLLPRIVAGLEAAAVGQCERYVWCTYKYGNFWSKASKTGKIIPSGNRHYAHGPRHVVGIFRLHAEVVLEATNNKTQELASFFTFINAPFWGSLKKRGEIFLFFINIVFSFYFWKIFPKNTLFAFYAKNWYQLMRRTFGTLSKNYEAIHSLFCS